MKHSIPGITLVGFIVATPALTEVAVHVIDLGGWACSQNQGMH